MSTFENRLRTSLSVAVLLLGAGACTEPAIEPDEPDDGIDNHPQVIRNPPPARCNQQAPFGGAVLVPGLYTTMDEHHAQLSSDELAITFARTDGSAGGSDLFVATRPSRSDAFSAPVPIKHFDTPGVDELYPTRSRDGRRMYLVANTLENPDKYDVYETRWDEWGAEFLPPRRVEALESADAPQGLYVVNDALWFSRRGPNSQDIFRAPITRGRVQEAAPVAGLDTTGMEATPVVSPDEKVVYLASHADAAGGGDADVFAVGLDTGRMVDTERSRVMATGGNDAPSWISSDGCRLYFSSDVLGSDDLWVAHRKASR